MQAACQASYVYTAHFPADSYTQNVYAFLCSHYSPDTGMMRYDTYGTGHVTESTRCLGPSSINCQRERGEGLGTRLLIHTRSEKWLTFNPTQNGCATSVIMHHCRMKNICHPPKNCRSEKHSSLREFVTL